MTEKTNPLREKLLAQGAPSRDKLVRYQRETHAMLEKNERVLRLQKWYAGSIWIFAVAFVTVSLLAIGYLGHTPEITLIATAFVVLIGGGVELIKHFINRSRVEVLKELKGLELQILSLQERLENTPR
jgi:hypothetical protein